MSAPPPPGPLVRALLEERPVFDAHTDSIGRALDLGHDLAVLGPGQLDFERGRRGGLGAVVLACWVDPEAYAPRFHERAVAMVGAVQEVARRAPDRVRQVGNGEALAAARSAGVIAAIAGIEGGHAIEGSLEKLTHLFDGGVRVLTLVWDNHLEWVRSCREGAGAGVPRGLSDFGREVVRRAGELGIVVDLSHAGERSFLDALETTDAPPIASHSGCKARYDHPRNLSDTALRRLAERDGVVGILFYPGFLDAAAFEATARVLRSDRYRDIRGENPAHVFLEQQEVVREAAGPFAIEPLLDHLEHAVEVAGIDHVGIGSDFDGILSAPHGLEDASGYGVLGELLRRRGFDREGLRKILGGNMERVFAQVTGRGSRAHEARIAPIDTAPIDTAPIDTAPIDTASIDTASIDTGATSR
jgi:membrane dipeptidase